LISLSGPILFAAIQEGSLSPPLEDEGHEPLHFNFPLAFPDLLSADPDSFVLFSPSDLSIFLVPARQGPLELTHNFPT